MKTKLTRQFVLLFLIAACSTQAQCATILLREQSSHQGSIVYLGDVADVSAATDSEKQYLITTPLLPAPPEGTTEFLRLPQLPELLKSQGVGVEGLSLGGADFVVIGGAVRPQEAEATPLQAMPHPEKTEEQLEEEVIAAITSHLVAETGHQDWQVGISLNASDVSKLNALAVQLQADGGKSPWSGTQRFELSSPGSQDTVTLYAHVEQLQDVVVAVHNIEPRSLISVSDVEIRKQGGNHSSTTFSQVDQVVGKEALRRIAPDTVLQSSQLRSPLLVRRGETAKVRARAGGVTVSTYAIARQDGALGDLVQLESLEGKQRFAARVSGWKELEVLPTGVTTNDFTAQTQEFKLR